MLCTRSHSLLHIATCQSLRFISKRLFTWCTGPWAEKHFYFVRAVCAGLCWNSFKRSKSSCFFGCLTTGPLMFRLVTATLALTILPCISVNCGKLPLHFTTRIISHFLWFFSSSRKSWDGIHTHTLIRYENFKRRAYPHLKCNIIYLFISFRFFIWIEKKNLRIYKLSRKIPVEYIRA